CAKQLLHDVQATPSLVLFAAQLVNLGNHFLKFVNTVQLTCHCVPDSQRENGGCGMLETEADRNGDDATVRLGHLASDLSFATRALRARLRHVNAEFYRSHDVEAGGIAI